MKKRRKGVAIIDTKKGILVVSGKGKKFILPGGGAERWESRRKATIRELYEETGLKTKRIKFIFGYNGSKWHDHKRRLTMNLTKVFLVNPFGHMKPGHEIKHISFWKPESKIKLSFGTKIIIEKYFNLKSKRNLK